jgi:hypothetical protein
MQAFNTVEQNEHTTGAGDQTLGALSVSVSAKIPSFARSVNLTLDLNGG